MPNQDLKPAAIRESWRPDSASADQRANRQRMAWRLLVSALLLLTISAFGYLLFSPLFHPNLRLYFLTAGSYDVMDIKPIPYFQDDAIRFLSMDGTFRKEDAKSEFSLMDSPEVVRSYLKGIGDTAMHESDVAFILLSAHSMLEGKQPFLKCSNFDPTKPETGSLSVEEVLTLLDRMTVGTTVLCLDLASSDSLGFEGSARDDFLYALRDLMKSRRNANQWILVSNSPQEESYVSTELRSSVFSYAITKGLQGSADLNKDATIDLDELARFVVGFTQSQVLRESGGNTNQTPVLFSTGANSKVALNTRLIASAQSRSASFSWSTLLSYVWGSDPSQEDSKDKAAEKEVEKVEKKNWLTEYLDESATRIQERTMGELQDSLMLLPDSMASSIIQSLGMSEEEKVVPSDSTPEDADTATTAEPKQETIANEPSASVAKVNQPSPTLPVGRLREPLPDLSRLADPKMSDLQLLQLAWQFCEYLELPQAGSMRPLDLAPHAWNEFTSYFHGVEQRLRTDSVTDSKTLRLQVTSEIVGAYQFAMTGRAKVGSLSKRVSEQMPNLDFADVAFPSIGFMESVAEYGGPTLPSGIASQIQQLDAALRSDTRDAFDKWHIQLPKDMSSQYVEFFWASQFASNPSTPWRVARRVLGSWRQFELLSNDPLNSNVKIQQTLTSSRIFLLDGTRQALDQIGIDWIDRCSQTLDKAEQALIDSSEQSTQLKSAFQLRNQSLAELSSVLQFRKIAATQLGSSQLDDDLRTMLSNLDQLCELLRDREECDLGEVRRKQENLKASSQRIQDYWIEETNQLLEGSSKTSISSRWITDALLAPPYMRSQLRNRLLSLPVSNNVTKGTEIDPDFMLPKFASVRLTNKKIEQQIQFESMAAKMAGMDLDSSLNETYQIAESISTYYSNLANRLSKAFDRIGPANTEKERKQQLQELRQADQWLRLIPSLDAHGFDGKPLTSKLLQLEFLQCLQQKLNATTACFQDALPQEVPFLSNTSERLAFLASALAGSEQTEIRQPARLSIRGTSSISLMADPQFSGEVVLQNVGKAIDKAWVLVDYDPNVLELEGPSSFPLSQVSTLPQKLDAIRREAEQELLKAIATGAESQLGRESIEGARARLNAISAASSYPIHPETSKIAPTVGLAPGQVVKIPFKIRRIGLGPSYSKLIWKLVGNHEYVRHEAIIQLPEAEKLRLQVDGIANSWAPTFEGVELFLWPNRETDFRLGLRNDSGASRVLSVDLVALTLRREITLPEGFLTASASQEIEDLLGPTKLIATLPEVALDSKSDTAWLPLQPVGRTDTAPPALGEDKPSIPIPTDQGLVLILKDKTTNQKYWRRVETRVRHPRSYIEPSVRYDAVAERAEIRLSARQLESVPAKGIQVVGRILEPLPRGTEMKLEGNVLAGETLSLYCSVPALGLRELTFEIDVDGFPRAFVIKVPCWRTNADIPVASDLQKIEFIEPRDGLNFGPNDLRQKVRLKIDAVPGAFESKRDYVEIGWDLDRDREFADEATVKFAADRQVDVAINSIANGRMLMTANVKDIALTLPPPALKNQKVNLLARLFAGGEMVWSKPIEIIADYEPPTITGVEITPSTTFPQGIDLAVRIGVDDAKLSGIASVELIIDSSGVGKFADSREAPKACSRQSDGSWTLSLPTKEFTPGRATLFVRAKDNAGNTSEETKMVLSILSDQDWQATLKSATQELTGVVLYEDKPLPEAKVTMEDEKGVLVHNTKTDERGVFRIPSVQSGKFKIVAIGVMKNRPRKAEQTVEVVTPPSIPIRLRMTAK